MLQHFSKHEYVMLISAVNLLQQQSAGKSQDLSWILNHRQLAAKVKTSGLTRFYPTSGRPHVSPNNNKTNKALGIQKAGADSAFFIIIVIIIPT